MLSPQLCCWLSIVYVQHHSATVGLPCVHDLECAGAGRYLSAGVIVEKGYYGNLQAFVTILWRHRLQTGEIGRAKQPCKNLHVSATRSMESAYRTLYKLL